MQEGRPQYFEAALSDFVFDVAAGGAIRHLVDRGHSVEQMMGELDYPVPRSRVEKAVYRYMLESEILLENLPDEKDGLQICPIKERREKLPETLAAYLDKYGEANVYMECPFGQWIKNDEKKLNQILSCLTVREQEYILGVRWGKNVMYHRLTSRMREIAMKLVLHTEEEWRFYCFKK
ncbi:MAG: hypothetical protein NC321_14045 [Clostridium sp.]|nr:hypothetical protein [Clostridium sp.]